MAERVQPQRVNVDAVLAEHATLPQEQPPAQPGLNGDAPVDVAPGVDNATPAQVQVCSWKQRLAQNIEL
ncbi:Hypothetical predicted protein [Paramuricea clavata]|uniref:Uncharacterized protein n=1 Tax=Paramuricea clavata TaxID=317549 RepID=A0A7D9HZP2_PARCT|nr:Hypothetical predicted protein [Paramuricea clavata]